MWCAGLGTSSILGACVLATLYSLSGMSYDLDSLVHAVGGVWCVVWLLALHTTRQHSKAFILTAVHVQTLNLLHNCDTPVDPLCADFESGTAADHWWWVAGSVWGTLPRG